MLPIVVSCFDCKLFLSNSTSLSKAPIIAMTRVECELLFCVAAISPCEIVFVQHKTKTEKKTRTCFTGMFFLLLVMFEISFSMLENLPVLALVFKRKLLLSLV